MGKICQNCEWSISLPRENSMRVLRITLREIFNILFLVILSSKGDLGGDGKNLTPIDHTTGRNYRDRDISRTPVESTESEFSPVRWLKGVRATSTQFQSAGVAPCTLLSAISALWNFAPAVRKVSLQVFFTRFGRLTAESSDSVLLTPKRENRGEKLYSPLVQSFEVPEWHPALCRVPPRNFASVVRKVSLQDFFTRFGRPTRRKFRFGTFDRSATRTVSKSVRPMGV